MDETEVDIYLADVSEGPLRWVGDLPTNAENIQTHYPR